LRQLKRYTRRIVMALDADAAGVKATLRGLQIARETLDREADFTFDARGLLRQEGRLQADIRVTTLPDELDPDEVVNQNPEAWPQLIEAAKPIVIHVMETLAADKDINDPKAKSEIAAQVMPLINDIPSAIERDTYVQQLARLLKVDESALLAEYRPRVSTRRPVRRPRRPTPRETEPELEDIPSAPPIDSPIHKLESYCLGIIMQNPEFLYKVDRALLEADLDRISANDFQLTNHQELFTITREAINQDYSYPVNFTFENLPFPLFDYVENILDNTQQIDPNNEKVLQALIRRILQLRQKNIVEYDNQIRFLMEEAQEEDQDIEELKKTIYNHTIIRTKIDKALSNKLILSSING
jgi:DNA primase